jgi:hypothetical protein
MFQTFPIEPFLPMHETILDALAEPNVVYLCADPDEAFAPYVGAMLDAGWLSAVHSVGYSEFSITTEGLRQREMLRAFGVADKKA